MTTTKLHSTNRIVFLLSVLWLAPAQGQETLLRWKNGDVLPGRLLAGGSDQIRWSSAIFAEDLLVDMNALDAIEFPIQAGQGTGAFRIGTVAGDVFTADLIGADEDDFLLGSKRYGQVRVNRAAVYSLNRRVHPNLVFDGSQFGEWKRFNEGPIRQLSYRVYQGNWTWGDAFPDLTALTPAYEARLAAGYLDLGVSGFQEKFAISFAGQVKVPMTGPYQFEGTVDDQVRLWIDGKRIGNVAAIAQRFAATVELTQGLHSLQLDYIDMGGEARLGFWMISPSGEYVSLAEANQTSGWRPGRGGHAQTERKRASLGRAIELPDSFEIDLELASSNAPRFVLALAQGRASAELNRALRLETWGDELVVVQDKVFEPVMTISPDMRELRLRLVFDSVRGELQVFSASGVLLVAVKAVQATTGPSGITLRNRGEDLCLRRLRVYRQPSPGVRPTFDPARPRVHLIDGQVLYGRLHITEAGASVIDQGGTGRDIDLGQVDRIAQPGVSLAVTSNPAELSYADGAIIRGQLEQANAAQVTLRTLFSDQPVTCALTGASLLRLGPLVAQVAAAGEDMDQLFTAAGRLRGRLAFDRPGSPLSWLLSGAAQPLPLASEAIGRIERRRPSVSQGPSFDQDRFPHTLHLKNGEVIPCQVVAYDQAALNFGSPFFEQYRLPALHIKAIEFLALTHLKATGPSFNETNAWLTDILTPGHHTLFGLDPVKLKRALTVPRFRRNSPDKHVLMAKNGDLKRGTLLGIRAQTLQFESKLRQQRIPIELMARVVDVGRPEGDPNKAPASASQLKGKIRAGLSDGSILIFRALESRDGKLIGRSDIYGDMAIPHDYIQELSMGGFAAKPFKSVFDAWVLRPAQEPILSQPPAPTDNAQTSEESTASFAEVTSAEPRHGPDLAPGAKADTAAQTGELTEPPLKPNELKLGKVQVDVRNRSIRFPVKVNELGGPVAYVLVTERGKTHASIFRTEVQALHIHLGLLLLDITPSYARQLPTNPTQALPGERVHVGITWTENGVECGSPLEYFVVTTSNASRLSRGPWVYNGSAMTDTGLAAESSGSVVSLWRDTSALINNPRPARADEEAYAANPEAFPTDITEFQMEICLVKD